MGGLLQLHDAISQKFWKIRYARKKGLNNPFSHKAFHSILRRDKTKASYFLKHHVIILIYACFGCALQAGPQVIVE